MVEDEAMAWASRQVHDLEVAGHFDRANRKGLNRAETKEKTLQELAEARQRSLLRDIAQNRGMMYDDWAQQRTHGFQGAHTSVMTHLRSSEACA